MQASALLTDANGCIMSFRCVGMGTGKRVMELFPNVVLI